jgi:Domain of unknown function (DUF4232)
MSDLRDLMERAARQVEDPDAFDQLRHRRSVRERRRRVGTAALALVIAAGGIGVAAVALRHQETPVVPGHSPTPSPIHSPSTGGPALCSTAGMQVSVKSTGAAGTIRSVWQAKNVSGAPCSSFGYPGMDVHAPSGWLNLQVHRGGFADINGAPKHILVEAGGSLYFVSYWSDVTTTTGCTQFDQAKVTLPDNRVSNVVSATGCLNPDSVDVGPVTTTAPSH